MKNAHLVTVPLGRGGIQVAMKKVVDQLGIKKKSPATRLGTPLQRICWRLALISSSYKKSWGMSVF
ncbi:hypothetical protein [Desulfopila inferna]|uniref:hypothetical protein n=1 Tax=Desulfopila inferna TaxID=468528 RepID=UPI001F05611A|nr:hypothetical protein [Desulfopila inferna]